MNSLSLVFSDDLRKNGIYISVIYLLYQDFHADDPDSVYVWKRRDGMSN